MNNNSSAPAFTLIELIIVLMIISTIVTVAVPYATRSNEVRKMNQECRNLVETIKYGIDLASDTKRTTRLILNLPKKAYWLEIETEAHAEDFEPVENFAGWQGYLCQSISITEVSGFQMQGKKYYLSFRPAEKWPSASFMLSVKNTRNRIVVRGKRVVIYEHGI